MRYCFFVGLDTVFRVHVSSTSKYKTILEASRSTFAAKHTGKGTPHLPSLFGEHLSEKEYSSSRPRVEVGIPIRYA
jgi:hypothetical protein